MIRYNGSMNIKNQLKKINSMDIITLKKIKLYAYHGCLSEEAKIGSEYIVDLSVKADLSESAESDKLTHTIDYVALNQVVKEEMAQRSELLEHVAKRIIDRVIKEFDTVKKAKVKVAKINPPIGGNVENVSVVLKSTRK